MAFVALLSPQHTFAQTWTFTTLANPYATTLDAPGGPMVMDANGNLYGTSAYGGSNSQSDGAVGSGTLFEMQKSGSTYTEVTLHNFAALNSSNENSDGYGIGGLAMDSSGNLYGVGISGGASGDGTVWEYTSSGAFKVLYTFDDGGAGGNPLYGGGSLAIDSSGNLYGTTVNGGAHGNGTIFELVNNSGTYSESTLYVFYKSRTVGGNAQYGPYDAESGVTIDANGNLYGAASAGGTGGTDDGVIFEYSTSNGFQTLYTFSNDAVGAGPNTAPTFDAAGNLWGTTSEGGSTNYGTIYELVKSSGGYTFKPVYTFKGGSGDGLTPDLPLIIDGDGDIFGATVAGGSANDGTIFELAAFCQSSGYQEKILHSINGDSDGEHPSSLFMAPGGDLFGASDSGGSTYPYGTVWEMTPPLTTCTQLTSSANPAYMGDVVFTANVTAYPPGTQIAGTVSFTQGSTSLGSATVANGSASITADEYTTEPGVDTVTATFNSTVPNQYGSSASMQQSFVSATAGSSAATSKANIIVTAAGTLSTIEVLTGGVENLDFTEATGGTCAIGTSYSTSQACSVNVDFTPTEAGLRTGAILLLNGSNEVIGTTYLSGYAQGAQVAFNPATQTNVGSGLNAPAGAAVDAAGNVYIADTSNSRVLKYPWNGTGYGAAVTLGSGLLYPFGVAVDGAGNVFIADTDHSRLLELPWNGSSYGAQVTVGSGWSVPYSLRIDGGGDLIVVDTGNDRVVKLPWTGSGYGTGITVGSGFNEPQDVAVDVAGNVYVVDYNHQNVVVVPWTGSGYGTEYTIGCCMYAPEGVAVDANQNVYVTDGGNAAAYKLTWNGTTWTTQTQIGTGLSVPEGIFADGFGNVYIADRADSAVFKLDMANAPMLAFRTSTPVGTSDTTDGALSATVVNIGNAPLTFASGSPSYPANFPENTSATNLCGASAVPVGGSCVVSADFMPTQPLTNNGQIVLTDNSVSPQNTAMQNVSAQGVGIGPAVSFSSNPLKFTSTPAGERVTLPLTITNTGNANLSITQLGFSGANANQFSETDNCTGTPVIATGTCTVQVSFTPTSASSFSAYLNVTDNALNTPQSASVTGTGGAPLDSFSTLSLTFPATAPGQSSTLPVTLTNNGTSSLTVSGITFAGSSPSAFSETDNCSTSIAPTSSCTVQVKFTPPGAGGYGAVMSVADSASYYPRQILLDGAGQGAHVAFIPAVQATVESGLYFPVGTAIDSLGNLYVADSKVEYGGVYEYPAGGGARMSIGTGLNQPDGVAVDSAGNVYISDLGNQRVVEVPVGGGAQITLGSGIAHVAGLGVDPLGNVFVATNLGGQLLEIPVGGGTPVVIGSGWGTPFGVAVDGAGDVFVADSNLGLVAEVPAGSTTQTNLLQIGTLGGPYGVAVDSIGNVYASDTNNNRVVLVNAASGSVIPVASGLNNPFGLSVDANGNLYIAGSVSGSVVEAITANQTPLSFASTLAGETSSDSPQTVTVLNLGNASLNFSAINYPADFPEAPGVVTDCSTSKAVAAGSTCTLSIDFAPQLSSATGHSTALSEAVNVVDNNLGVGATQTVQLSGTEIAVVPAATPTFSPLAGTYTSEQSVTIGDATPGVTIYYTTDGTKPTTSSAVYNNTPISISTTETLRAIAAETGWANSGVATGVFTLKVPAPSFSPVAGTFTAVQSVTISDKLSGATIYYTTDGSTPVVGQTGTQPYSSAIPVNSTTTIEAIAVMTGWTNSGVASGTFTLKMPAPAFSPVAGTYTAAQSVMLGDKVSGATIYYTTDGSTPVVGQTGTQPYSSAIPVNSTTTIEAIAVMTGWTNSGVASGTFTLKMPAPAFSPVAGTYTAAQSVMLGDKVSGATIYYTTDGSTPVVGQTGTQPYSSAIPVNSTTTIEAIAVLAGWTNSGVASAAYTFKVPAPTFSPVAGTYTSAQTVMLNDKDANATIWYTTDGSTPTVGGGATTHSCTPGTGITIASTTTVNAIGSQTGWTNSGEATTTYTIK